MANNIFKVAILSLTFESGSMFYYDADNTKWIRVRSIKYRHGSNWIRARKLSYLHESFKRVKI